MAPIATLPPRPDRREDFHIAIFCALPIESDAVRAVFDHQWDNENDDQVPFDKAVGDDNAYVTGVIGRHNVVLAYLPNMGSVSAAHVAKDCQKSYPNISLALVVGICGVVPGNDGIERLLGDVIVSKGVINYEFGRKYDDKFVRKDTIQDNYSRHTGYLKTAMAKFTSLHDRRNLKRRMNKYLEDLQQDSELKAHYPGKEKDWLFEADYRHAGDEGAPCESTCCPDRLVRRQRLLGNQDTDPVVHVGTVACGSGVIRSAKFRDMIAQTDREKPIAFEMEGIGAWDVFPTLIIKGACDYADSHKTKVWQHYAAAVAAACVKGFLFEWKPSGTSKHYEETANADKNYFEACTNYLSPPAVRNGFDNIKNFTATIWLLDQDAFQKWYNIGIPRTCYSDSGRFLTIQGNPFSGKSALMRNAVDWSLKQSSTITLHHFFNVASRHNNKSDGTPVETSTSAFLRNILGQLIAALRDKPWESIREWGKHIQEKSDTGLWLDSRLEKAIVAVIMRNGDKLKAEKTRIRIFVDAVNECLDVHPNNISSNEETQGHKALSVLEFLSNLLKSTAAVGIDICVCVSRRYHPIFGNGEPVTKLLEVHNYTKAEVKKYVQEQLREITDRKLAHRSFVLLHEHWLDDFSWAKRATTLVLQNLSTFSNLQKKISLLHAAHETLFEDVLRSLRDSQEDNSELLLLLQISLVAKRPLTTGELRHAMAFSSEDAEFNYPSMQTWADSDDGYPQGEKFERVIRQKSGGLLHVRDDITPDARHVAAAHSSLASFLCGAKGLGSLYQNSTFTTTEHCHLRLFRTCVNVINYCDLVGESDVEIVDYACEFWLHHAKGCGALAATVPLPDFMEECEHTRTGRLIKRHVELATKSYAEESAYLEDTQTMISLYAVMGCTQLLEAHLHTCLSCKEYRNPNEEHMSLDIYFIPLMSAIIGNNYETAQFLLDRHPTGDINSSFANRTLLYHTCYFTANTKKPSKKSRLIDCVTYLLDQGADMFVRSGLKYEYPLFVAIVSGDEQLVRHLVQHASNKFKSEAVQDNKKIRISDDEGLISLFRLRHRESGWTALHVAVESGQPRVERLRILNALLKLAPKNKNLLAISDREGNTPVALARLVDDAVLSRGLVESLENFALKDKC